MSATVAAAPSNPAPSPGVSLRLRGAVLFVGLIVEALLGNSLAVAGSPYPILYLLAHIAVALLLTGYAAHALRNAIRRYGAAARLASVLALLATAGATIAGTVFLVGGQAQGALDGMEGLAVVGLIAAILQIVWGGPRSARPVTAG